MAEGGGMRRGRLLLVLILVLGGLNSATADAQPPGSELIEALASDVAGDDAYLALKNVEAFPAGGGDAVLEADTAYEETISYAYADAGSNRLVGLTRPSPLAHSAGVFVEAPPQEGSSAEATPAPAEAPPSSTPDESTTTGDESPSSTSSDEAANVAPPDACEIATDQTCTELLGPIIGDPPSIDDVCGQLTAACDDAQQVIDDLETGDPCDPDNIGQTCVEYIGNILDPFINDDPCDPDNTGQTCVEFIGDIVGLFINDDPCDPDDTGQTCTEYIQPDPCDISADSPYVGDLHLPPRNNVVIGNASARCPFPGPVILVICLEYGLVSELTIEQPPCSTWPSAINRVDGHDWQLCKPGFWRTYAFVMVGGFVVDDAHSGVVQILPEDCLIPTGET